MAVSAAAQEPAAGPVTDAAQTEQPMGGIGLSYTFATNHLPESRSHPLIVLELFADPESRVIGCSIVYPEGLDDDEAYYCRKPLGKRTDFPAIGPDGNAAYGVGRVHVRKRGADFPITPADLDIMVSDLPGELERFEVTIMAFIDEGGAVRNCQRTTSNAELSLVACQIAGQHIFAARQDPSGEFVSYVANMRVAFIAE